MGRSRSAKNKGLPPNLYLRKGIYYYRDVRTKKEYSVGSNKSLAITEAIQANLAIYQPKESLVDRINSVHCVTLHEWLDTYKGKVNSRGLKEKTLYDYESRIKLIKLHFNDCPIENITPRDVATFISEYPKKAMAKLLRSTMLDAFNEAIADGVIKENPVSVTKPPKTSVQRSRLSLEEFKYALEYTNDKYRHMFLLAVLTAQRISDIINMKWDDIKNDRLYVTQIKTGSKVAIPLSLRLESIGCSINDVLNLIDRKSDKICGNTTAKTLRGKFIEALPKHLENKPTFHEIRSLSARLYEEEKSAEFAKKILGHKSMRMTDKYLDDRGNGYVEL
ncbi:TPA: tyrosine-type recombinase/integrase [Proteus mirabilis]|nr:tyrosine-type recombinase/integrase [Proteus mirabilis]MBI6323222.1 tyrosine-type recombinase/integrase [Proteus mirabilis]HEJ9702753.1 tyrosine-type recombinase/integrase [Proteus mirabilis]HEK1986928.1 tyrosine-type recombinase/integrase [Proteus mirabilis]